MRPSSNRQSYGTAEGEAERKGMDGGKEEAMELIFKHQGLVVHRSFSGRSLEALEHEFHEAVSSRAKKREEELCIDGVAARDLSQLHPRAIVHSCDFRPQVSTTNASSAPRFAGGCRGPTVALLCASLCLEPDSQRDFSSPTASQSDSERKTSAFSGREGTVAASNDAERSVAFASRKVEHFVACASIPTKCFSAGEAESRNLDSIRLWLKEHESECSLCLVQAAAVYTLKDLRVLAQEMETALSKGGELILLLNMPAAKGKEHAKAFLEQRGEGARLKRAVLWRRDDTPFQAGDELSPVAARIWRIFSYIQSLPPKRPIHLSRHGQSEFNVDDRIGGDCNLTSFGRSFACDLGSWGEETLAKRREEEDSDSRLAVWTSTLNRAIQSVSEVPVKEEWRRYIADLDEIKAGVMDGMTYADIEASHPEETAKRQQDKLRYRYPRGESYEDLMARVESVLLDLEKQTVPTLVLAHQAVLRCVYSYFLGKPLADVPFVSFPSHSVVTLTEEAGECIQHTQLLTPKAPK